MVRGNFELVSTAGRLPGSKRRVAIIGAHIPPQTRASLVEEINEQVKNEISKLKNDYEDPFIILAGEADLQSC